MRTHKKNQRSTRIEQLENRSLFAADLVLGTDGVLNVTGTSADDSITVQQVGWGDIRVTIANGSTVIKQQGFSGELVKSLLIRGNAGNDTILNTTNVPSEMYGDDGNDYLRGGSANDRIFGGNGNDAVYGGDGNDYLNGNAGSDSLYGGAGNDVVLGGDDTVVDYIWGGAGSDDFNRKPKDVLMDFSDLEKDFDRAAK